MPLVAPRASLAPVVTAAKLDQDGLRKPGLHKPGLRQLPPQVIALTPRGPPQATALVAQAGAIKITTWTAVFNVCYSLQLLC